MKKRIGHFILLNAFSLLSCKGEPIEPFELTVADYDYSSASSLLYCLTDQKLTITFRGELEGEKDSVLFSTTDLPRSGIRKLSKINIDSLAVLYRNNCIADGDVKVIRFKKGSIYKQVQLNNYYHPLLSPAIEIINGIVPKKHQMYYNKEALLQKMAKCQDFNIIQKREDLKWDD
ncbi:MAG: hypothetical protein V7724_18450 [Sediminicola sp.]|tara:strand:+ start:5139 stop:5663 length:525 start_codon:yes stop_codon:yes gene_type:complete